MTGVPAERAKNIVLYFDMDAILAEAARQGCAVLAVFSGGEFAGWKLVPWDR
jgi:hypothetical protein